MGGEGVGGGEVGDVYAGPKSMFNKHGQNVSRLFDNFPNFPSTPSEAVIVLLFA